MTQAVLQHMRGYVREGTLSLVTDSQASVAALENMKGNSDIFRYVDEIHSSLHANGIRLHVTWEP